LYSNNLEIIQKELKIPKPFESFEYVKNFNQLIMFNPNTNDSRNLLIMAGFPEGQIKIFESFEMIKQIDFHKVF